jgi:hypothetical protein
MGRSLTLDVPDQLFRSIDDAARASGRSVQEWALDVLRSRVPPDVTTRQAPDEALADLLKALGSIDVGDAEGADNAAIDRDLAVEYGSAHEVD